MKKLIATGSFLALAGCISNGPRMPTEIAKGATSGIWTSQPAAQVQACVNQITRQNNNAHTRFLVNSNDTSKQVYATTISVFSDGRDDDALQEKVAAICAKAHYGIVTIDR
ncbi:hypothetical protein [Sphingomonas sp. CV7422]|uniref:hypothetical protein n=1 Tax=Sphingomonas sp. CV7422 TaxID=3018036 RepID=UPI0022FDD616|nr:hypothetical protein [Sphingomonas sp. CV7422]